MMPTPTPPPTPTARKRNRRRKFVMQDFEPLSVIGEGHFGKVLLVRWNNGAAFSSYSRSISSSSSSGGSGRHTRQQQQQQQQQQQLPPPSTIEEGDGEAAEEADGGGDSYAVGEDVAAISAKGSSRPEDAMTRSGRHGNDRYLAVKEVALHKGTSLPGVLNERQILGVLREHPFVVTLRCAWRRGNFLYYGLDFLPGADLFELFRRNSIKMDLQAARVYGGQVALALEHLHEHGICYRDLKVRGRPGSDGDRVGRMDLTGGFVLLGWLVGRLLSAARVACKFLRCMHQVQPFCFFGKGNANTRGNKRAWRRRLAHIIRAVIGPEFPPTEERLCIYPGPFYSLPDPAFRASPPARCVSSDLFLCSAA